MTVRVPIVAIVGRPNVGKSTLFNRILGERRAIVEDVPGVTRDRNYALVERFSVPFVIVDTGGFEKEPEDPLGRAVVEQTLLAAEECDVILAVFDGSTGLHPGDEDVADLLRRYQKPIYYVVNKCDGAEQAIRVAEFYSLGLDRILDVSALHGRGVRDMIDTVLSELPQYEDLLALVRERQQRERDAREEARLRAAQMDEDDDDDEGTFEAGGGDDDDLAEEDLQDGDPYEGPGSEVRFAPVYVPGETELSEDDYEKSFRLRPLERTLKREAGDDASEESEADEIPEIPCINIAIVGRPNVGKSTLLNTLTGERRAITSPIAGTTRDILDLTLTRDGQQFLIVDTAGLRKKAKVEDKVERYSTLRTLHALGACDVAVVLIDAVDGATEQDTKIAGLAHEQGKGIIIAVNKWDLVEKDHKTVKEYTDRVREAFKFAPYAPIIYISALSGRRCPRVLESARHAAEERLKRVSTSRLNRVLERAIARNMPSQYRGRSIKMYYSTQVDTAPPRFALFFNYPRALHFSFMRYLKNVIREEFGFDGTDIKLMARKR